MKLYLILGDQLSQSLTMFHQCRKTVDRIVMFEVMDEASYVKHHRKKLVLVFSAMRHFAKELRQQGYQVTYVPLEDERNTGSLTDEMKRAVDHYQPDEVCVTFPGEYRVLEFFRHWQKTFSVSVTLFGDNRFLTQPDDFAQWAKGRKQLRMEYFYREVRKRYGILMNDAQPEGGQWNYDHDNRRALPKNIEPPEPTRFPPDKITKAIIKLVEERFDNHFGELNDFDYAVTRKQALTLLDEFIAQRLPDFGDYQDAMRQGNVWLFHSHLSFYLNNGLLLPDEVVSRAESAYHNGDVSINAAEGFIRQIIGWREYVRGLYWLKMPDYKQQNFLKATRALPDFYWTGETTLNCLKQCIIDTQQYAYAHHIQRLMVLGNFALLAGIDPDAVNDWYLLVYADAYEWVELPNVTGMVLFADGGVVASKPYIASGAYINRMSDYCQHCEYKVTQKNGDSACPFNYLYWDFLLRHQKQLGNNPRLAMPYRTLGKMDEEKIQWIQSDAKQFLDGLSS